MQATVPGNVHLYYWNPSTGFQCSDIIIPEGLVLSVEEPKMKDECSNDFFCFGTAQIPGTNRTQAYALKADLVLLPVQS